MTESKYVIVVDRHLSAGLRVNTAAVLATSIGKATAGVLGPDVKDGSGRMHRGITQLPIAILASDKEGLAELYDKASVNAAILLVGFTSTAQRAKRYDEYEQHLSMLSTEELDFIGLGLFGPSAAVAGLTGSLPLLR